jgi:hypothetical protein
MSVVLSRLLLNGGDPRSFRVMSVSTVSTSRAEPVINTPLPFAIRMLRRLNPVIVTILRSPLHRLLSRHLLVLTYESRTTGLRRTLPLSYVALGAHVYLCTRTAFWWRNLRNGKPVELRLRGRRTIATPTVLDPASREALDGLREFLGANAKTGVMLYQVRAGSDGRPMEDDLRREVLRSVVVRLEMAGA